MTRTDPRLQALRDRVAGIAFGGDYNPEQWPEDVWQDDMRLMKAAGVNLVTVGVFAWANVQTDADTFDFGWLDRNLDLLASHGIAVDLATMTASPPPWLVKRHPEILPVRADGVVLHHGGRQHFSPSSLVFRQYATAFVEQLATRYADHPALALWHVGNEYGCHVSLSYDDASVLAFREWLRDKYGEVASLNEAWQTSFWSQRYTDFDEVGAPRIAPTYANPGQQLDFARFSNDAMLACYAAERDILRRITPDVPVTTNFLSGNKSVDMFRWAREVDVSAVDHYVDPAETDPHLAGALIFDIVRSTKGGEPWMLMEQAPNAVNWRAINAPKRPGQNRLWSWQAVAQGADAVMYFQWRQSRGGAEKFHSGMLPLAGEDSRVHREIVQLGHELACVPELVGARSAHAAAILMDWNSWWGLEIDSHPSQEVKQLQSLHAWHAPLFEAALGTDVISPDTDFGDYRLIVVPSLYLLETQTAERLADWVRAGGSLVVTYFSGIVDGCDRLHATGYLGPLQPVLGVVVEEFAPLQDGEVVRLDGADGELGLGTLWSEWVRLAGATAWARFADGAPCGGPAVTRHDYGDGVAWYVATNPEMAIRHRLLSEACATAGVAPALRDLPAGVQATVRSTATDDFLFLLNHSAAEHSVDVGAAMRVRVGVDAGTMRSTVVLAPGDVAVLHKEASATA